MAWAASTMPYSNPARPYTGFIVEPGGYCPCTARLNRGKCGESRSLPYSPVLMPFTNKLVSNPGALTNASTSPLRGSIATTAPRRPFKAS